MKPTSWLQPFKAVYRYGRIPFRRWSASGRPTAYVLGMSPWKTFINDWFPDRKIVRRDRTVSKWEFYTSLVPWMLADKRSVLCVWGYKHPPFIIPFCERFGVNYVRVEDGFLRSVALGATKAPPLSLCFDSPALYFDATAPSRLEQILQSHDFAGDPVLMERAREGMRSLIETRLSKYNTSNDVDIETIYGPKDRKRVLVVGQVEGDMSIKKGCNRAINNNDLVRIAARENLDAQIIYKPHPEVLHGTRSDPPQSKPDEVRGIAMILEQDITLADAFKTVDHVYTITSLSGFEALIRGIKVTCLGMPFYAGWGATDDRQRCERRTARHTAEEIFAAAYILYPRYFDPILRKEVQFEQALDLLYWMKRTQPAKKPSAVPAVKKVSVPAVPPLKLVSSNAHKAEIQVIRKVLDILDPPAKKSVAPKPKEPLLKVVKPKMPLLKSVKKKTWR